MLPRKNKELAIVDYWNAYGDNLNLPPGQSRTWDDLPNDTQGLLKDRVLSLLISIAENEGVFLSGKFLVLNGVQTRYLEIKWGAKHVILFPWLEMSEAKPGSLVELCSELPRNILTIAITPQSFSREIMEMAQEARSKGFQIILAAPNDVDALAKHSWKLTELINFKVIKIYLESGINAVDADAFYQEFQVETFRQDLKRSKSIDLLTLQRIVTLRKDDTNSWIRHPDAENIWEILNSNNFLLLSGKSASGKTVLALSTGFRLESMGKSVWYVDVGSLTNKRTYALGISLFLEVLKSSKDVVVILDDIHTQLTLAQPLVHFLRTLQLTLFDQKLSVIGILWPEFQSEVGKYSSNVYSFNVLASSLKDKLISHFGKGLTEEQQSIIRSQSGDDLFVLRLWLENSSEDLMLSETDLSRKVWNTRSQNIKIPKNTLNRVIYLTYLIGQYECDTPIPFLRNSTDISDKYLQELVKAKLITQKNNVVSPPHRSFANLIVRYLATDPEIWGWFRSKNVASNIGEMFVKYLEAIDPSQVWSVLKLIESGQAAEIPDKSKLHIEMIMSIWRSIDGLLQKMEEQQAEDPTWGKAISSCFFAIQGLCTVGKKEAVKESILFIRDCYKVVDGQLEINLTKLSTVADFDQIRERMAWEEREGGLSLDYGLETSDIIDIDRFHANWACGLAIGAEAYVKDLSTDELTKLAIAVENRVEEGGYFYPSRVPWLSARVLMGLSLCGRNIENSHVVKKVADWLLRDRENGGAREGNFWVPGTDGWNSILETSAMAIIALRSVGIPHTNQVLIRATDSLIKQKSTWMTPGSELDGAIALEAYLSMTNSWDDVRYEALYLANWATAIALWRNATVSAQRTHEQSCRAAATAAFLIKTMWGTLKSDLPELLLAFGIGEITPDIRKEIMKDKYEYDVTLSYAGENRDYVDKVANQLHELGVRVFYDKFEEVDLWGKDLFTHLDDIYRKKARYCVMFISREYERKVWTNHERRSAQARAMSEFGEYILPVRFDDTEIPGVLPTTGYLNAQDHSPRELAKFIYKKLNTSRS